jgi:D-alanyl-lipoteichoic acid acyltransferase DltB (MBOAT superfamily)
MVFNSVTFLVFLAVVLTAYYRLKHRGQNVLLLVASYVFYGWWDWRFLSLLVFTSGFDYWCALWLDRESNPAKRKMFLAFSMMVNLGVLGVFKYFNFFAASFAQVLAACGLKATFPVLHVILPLGISFYTFVSMSYTIDVYRRELPAARNPLDFLLFVAFFPHLVAGPIVRASFLLPQCQRPRVINPTEVINGLGQILLGFVKKVVIADRLAGIVNWGFTPSGPPLADANAWLIIYAFAFQIYGDFSGYSDIARGLSKLMGFELPANFKAPYLVSNPSAFWQHWHISLSTWLRDYLYIPLGGNRRGAARTYLNLMTTMLLGGLWHGAGAAYLLWGCFHGAMLAVHRVWHDVTGFGVLHAGDEPGRIGPLRSRLGRGLLRGGMVVAFFQLTCIGWLLFRAGAMPPQLSQVQVVRGFLQAMIQWPSAGISPLWQPVLILGGMALLFQWQHAKLDHFSTWPVRWQAASVVLALTLITGLGVFSGAQFIYFQF